MLIALPCNGSQDAVLGVRLDDVSVDWFRLPKTIDAPGSLVEFFEGVGQSNKAFVPAMLHVYAHAKDRRFTYEDSFF